VRLTDVNFKLLFVRLTDVKIHLLSERLTGVKMQLLFVRLTSIKMQVLFVRLTDIKTQLLTKRVVGGTSFSNNNKMYGWQNIKIQTVTIRMVRMTLHNPISHHAPLLSVIDNQLLHATFPAVSVHFKRMKDMMWGGSARIQGSWQSKTRNCSWKIHYCVPTALFYVHFLKSYSCLCLFCKKGCAGGGTKDATWSPDSVPGG